MSAVQDDTDDLLAALDALLAERPGPWWDSLFADRSRPCPFFVDAPDENLVEWLDRGLLPAGRALDLGCGNGRNALHLAARGFTVDAVDFSARAVDWARERARGRGLAVDVRCCSVFDAPFDEGAYDLVYDSGCFHHLPPHRRAGYTALVDRALRPGGRFGLVCFRPEGGSGLTDQQVYERRSLGGGLGYTEDRLRALWGRDPFSVLELRQMLDAGGGAAGFGADFLWAMLAAKAQA